MKEAFQEALEESGLPGAPGTYIRVEGITEPGVYFISRDPSCDLPLLFMNHPPFNSDVFTAAILRRSLFSSLLLLDNNTLVPADPSKLPAMRGYFMAWSQLYEMRRWRDANPGYCHEAISIQDIGKLDFENGKLTVVPDEERNGFFRLDITESSIRGGKRFCGVVAKVDGLNQGKVITDSIEWFNQRVQKQKLPLWKAV